MNLDTIGGRKVASALGVLVVSVATVAIKGDVPPNMESIMQFLFGALVAGNAVEHVTGAVKARADAGASGPEADSIPAAVDHTPALNELTQRVAHLAENDRILGENVSLIQQSLALIIKRTGIDKMPDVKG